MKSRLPLLPLLLLGVTFWSPAWGQTIYKCGTAYSQQPCAGAVMVDVSDPRTPAQKAQTDAATAGAAKMAAQMEKERLAREKIQVAKLSKKPLPVRKTGKTGSLEATHKTGAKQKKKAPEFFTAAVALEKKDQKIDTKSDGKVQTAVADKTDRAIKP